MPSWFYNLGQSLRPKAKRAQWVWQSFTGSEEEAIQAEYEAGRELAREFALHVPADADPAARELVAAIGAELAGCVVNKSRRFTFTPVGGADPNAFALPGGFIFITRSLLVLCSAVDEKTGRASPHQDEIAFVLAHEMGHVMRGHAMERMVNAKVIELASRLAPVGGMLGRLMVQTGSSLVSSAYSQDQELEADSVAMKLVTAARFDPAGGARLFRRLRQLAPKDRGVLGPYFATHPDFATRLKNVGAKG